MSPSASRAFWALFIIANLWLANGAPSIAFVFLIGAIIARVIDSLDRKFDMPPAKGDIEI